MTRWAALALCAAVAIARPARAAQSPEELVDSAARLHEAGRWTESRELLGRRLAGCSTAAEPRSCRITFGRALAYTYQREAQRDPSQREALLSRAITHYRDVLQEAPADGTSFTNLALAFRVLGRGAELEALARAAISQDPDSAGFYWLLLGDAYESRRAWVQAAAAYRSGIGAAPADETPRRRIVDVYGRLPRDSVTGLYRLVSEDRDWERRFPDAAARAYELVVNSLGQLDSTIARRACRRWINLLADSRMLTVGRLDAVGQQWLGPELEQLKRFVRNPTQVPPREGLWGGDDGIEAVGRAALSLGRQRLAAGDPAGADTYWQAGLRAGADFAPVSLDLAVEMAALYERNRALDPAKAKFRMIEERLLSEKASAYQRADQEAIQRFHTVLGLIYVQRRVWRSTDVPWKNAVYQLDHALGTARRRDAAAGTYQPLPELRALLAHGYDTTGMRDTARATYVAAAQAYLDLDQLGPAGQMLTRGRALGGAAQDPRLAALDHVIQARAATGTAMGPRPSAEQCDATAQQATGFATGLPAAFVKRQRFKVLADCLLAGPADVRPEDAARVLTTAVRDSVPLVGVGDLVRIERSQTVVNRTLRLATERGRPDLKQSNVRPDGPTIRLHLPFESRPTYIPVPADALKGADVIQRLGADAAASTVRVHQGAVTVDTRDATAADQARIQAKLQGVADLTFARQPVTDSTRRPPPPPPELEAARRQAGELRARAVAAGATDAELASGDAASRDAASLIGQGSVTAALELWQRASGSYAQAGRGAESRRDARDTLEQEFRTVQAEAMARRNQAERAGISPARLAAGDSAMRHAVRLMSQGNATAALEQARAAAELWGRGADDRRPAAAPKALLEAILVVYAQVLETGNLDAVRRVVPEFDARRLGDIFKRADGIRAQFRLADFTVEGDRARAVITVTLQYRDRETRTVKQEELEQRALLVRGPAGWQVTAIR